MTVPIRFPREADVIYEQAERYRRLPPAQRLSAIFDLIATGLKMMHQSPHRAARLRLREASDAEWQRAQKELFARHGL